MQQMREFPYQQVIKIVQYCPSQQWSIKFSQEGAKFQTIALVLNRGRPREKKKKKKIIYVY